MRNIWKISAITWAVMLVCIAIVCSATCRADDASRTRRVKVALALHAQPTAVATAPSANAKPDYSDVLAAVNAGRTVTVYAGMPLPADCSGDTMEIFAIPGEPNPGVWRCQLIDGVPSMTRISPPPAFVQPIPQIVAPPINWLTIVKPVATDCVT